MITKHIESLSGEGSRGSALVGETCGLFYHELSPAVSKRRSLEVPLSLRELLQASPHRGEALFLESYKLLRLCFPDKNVVAHRDTLLYELRDTASTFDIHVLTSDQSVIGAVNSRLLTATTPGLGRVGAIEHLYTNPDFRGQGIGNQLVLHVEERMATWGAHLMLCELNDPLLMSRDAHNLDHHAGITAEKRRAFWKKRGFQCVDAPYIQPRTETGNEEVYHMMVGLKHLTNGSFTHLTTEDFIETLREYHTAWAPSPQLSPTVEECYRSIHNQCGSCITLIDLEVPRTIVGVASRSNQNTSVSRSSTDLRETRGISFEARG